MSVETERRDLRSFQHCKKDVDLVCFTLPELCPLCQQSTSTTEMRIPPYLLPSPFCSSKKTLCSVVLRPTFGDFFRGYSRTCNLHIGVTDSQGYVYDYDEKGLHQRSIWPECLVVISNTCMDPVLWDTMLQRTCGQSDLWLGFKYNEMEWNCFDFVLNFLQFYPEFGADMSKEMFCERFLKQKTKRAEQYIYLYQQVSAIGCVAVSKS